MPSEPRVPLPMSSFSRRSSNITLSVSPTLSASSVSNVLYTNNQVTLQQRPKKLSLEVTSSSSSTSSRRNSTSTSTGANVRRCHSVRVTGTRTQSFASLNGVNYSPSLKSRRVSSSVLYDKQIDIDYATYDKYKISRANPDSLVNLVIDDTITPGNNVHRIIVLGSAGSGKSTIISSFKFQLEEQRSANNSPKCTNVTKSKTNNNEIILHFCEVEITTCNQDNLSYYQPDAYLVMYSVSDRESFQLACHTLANIQKCQSSDHKPVILVANKSDLVRSRCISKQEARQIAIDYNCKYIETSCTISLNIDFLLAGIGAQINLRSSGKKKGTTKKPSIFKRLLNRTVLNRSRSCDNLSVL